LLSPETLETYRRMTPGERLELTLSMMGDSEPYLLSGTPNQVARKFQRINEQNDERNRSMLTQLSLSQTTAHEST